MDREELEDAINELVDTRHMLEYALSQAMNLLDLGRLAELFDQVADHHSLLTDHIRPRVGLAAEQSDRTIKPPDEHRCGHCNHCLTKDSEGRCCMDPATTNPLVQAHRRAAGVQT